MFDGLFMLLSLSTLMAIASFLAGLLPLSFALSPSQLRVVSTLGMGVLVGTSLLVIIPEGVETLYSANDVARPNSRRELYRRAGAEIRWTVGERDVPRLLTPRDEISEIDAINALPGPVIPGGADSSAFASKDDPPKTPTTPGEIVALDAEDSTVGGSGSSDEPAHADSEAHHAWMGISLISGFILMYLIDTLPALRPQPPPQRMNIYSLSDLGATASPSSMVSATSRPGFSTTLGLVIHAAADGIALGASSTQPALSFIIFFAIMVHKAPAAFGLTSILLKQGLGKRQARAHLAAFSLAAPCGAIVTWMLVGILGGGGTGVSAARTMKWWTGVILLFSGGTFLYVAMHTMQEDESNHGGDEGSPNGYLDSPSHREGGRQKPQKSLRLVLTAVVGMLLPLVTQIGHAG